MMIQHPHYSDVQVNPDDKVDLHLLHREGSCSSMPAGLFYYPDDEEPMGRIPWITRTGQGFGAREVYEYLRGYCAGCPVVEECFTHALTYEEHGFWGGTSPPDRRDLRSEHGIALRHMYDPDVLDQSIISARLDALADIDDLSEEEDYEWP